MNPYFQLARLDKPIGIWLLFFPAGWAVAMAADPAELARLLLLMLLGATLTRAAGCILNDLADRKLDAEVARTRTRPLASGRIRVPQALLFLAFLLAGALALALSLPGQVLVLALLALPMIALYPWMKRFTWWPQAFLGLTFNLSALMGWAATGSNVTLPAFTLYAAALFWTLGYDTIYAVQDMADDARIGIKSSARAVGEERLRQFVTLCYTAVFVLLLATGLYVESGPAYYIGLGLAGLHAGWQVKNLPCPPERAGALFRSNQWLGLALLLGILADRLI